MAVDAREPLQAAPFIGGQHEFEMLYVPLRAAGEGRGDRCAAERSAASRLRKLVAARFGGRELPRRT